jgi:hypothetical protein
MMQRRDMRDQIVGCGWRTRSRYVVKDTLHITHWSLLARTNITFVVTSVLTVTEFTDVLLNTLFGECTLYLFAGSFGVGKGDFVFVNTGGSFFKEIAASTAKDRWLPVEAAMHAGEEED